MKRLRNRQENRPLKHTVIQGSNVVAYSIYAIITVLIGNNNRL